MCAIIELNGQICAVFKVVAQSFPPGIQAQLLGATLEDRKNLEAVLAAVDRMLQAGQTIFRSTTSQGLRILDARECGQGPVRLYHEMG